MINISTYFTNYNFKFNRNVNSSIELPYSREDVEIGVNELANGENFNTSLNKIQTNLMYMYSMSKLANPNLPKQYSGWIGPKATNGDSLSVKLRNIELYSVVKYDSNNDAIPQTIPYFSIQDSNRNTYNIIFTVNEVRNPKAETSLLPVGTEYTIELVNSDYYTDSLAAERLSTILTEIGFTTTIDTNTPITLTIDSPVPGGIFNGRLYTDSYQSLFGDNCIITVTQGSFPVRFSKYSTTNANVISQNQSVVSNFNELNNISFTNGTLSGYKVFFNCSDTRIQALSADINSTDYNNYKFIGYTDTYGINNKLNFLKINSSAIYLNNLYVSDEQRNNIVQLNINGFINNDSHRFNRFFETNIIGGDGEIRSNYRFKQPEIIQFYNGKLYVLDKGNEIIKIYDKDLKYISSIRKSYFIRTNPPVKIKLYNDNFYWLTANGILTILDLDLNVLSTYNLTNDITGEVKDFIISSQNNNLYILTSSNIYKYFLDTIVLIGNFNLSSNNINQSTQFQFFNLLQTGDNIDVISVYSYINKNLAQLLIFEEDGYFFNLLSNYDFEIYTNDEIYLNKDEFASNLAYNKSLNKTINNILQLRNFIYRKINLTKQTTGEYTFTGVTYFNVNEFDIVNYKPEMNNFIGTNEIFSRSVINRCLNKLYDLLLEILDLYKSNVTVANRLTKTISKSNLGIMLETFNGNPNDYMLLETYNTNLIGRSFLSQEIKPLT